MATVTLEPKAAEEFLVLPERIKARGEAIIIRLEGWPQVSGAKPLREDLAGHYRMRIADYRVQLRVEGDEVIIERIGHRDGFYE